MERFVKYLVSPAFFETVLIIVILFCVLHIIKEFLIKGLAYKINKNGKKGTFVGVALSVLQYVVVVVAFLVILGVHGVDITAIIASLGIIATIIGFALQDTLKDLISGINIYSNNFYKVGDVVRYQGNLCEVKYFSAKVTKFRNLITDSTYTVSNSAINQIEKVKNRSTLKFFVPYKSDNQVVDQCFENALLNCKDIEHLDCAEYRGVKEFDRFGVTYAVDIKCNPMYFEDVNDQVYSFVYKELAEKSIYKVKKNDD